MKTQVTGRLIIIKSTLQGGSSKALLILLSLLFVLRKCYHQMFSSLALLARFSVLA